MLPPLGSFVGEERSFHRFEIFMEEFKLLRNAPGTKSAESNEQHGNIPRPSRGSDCLEITEEPSPGGSYRDEGISFNCAGIRQKPFDLFSQVLVFLQAEVLVVLVMRARGDSHDWQPS